MYLSGIKGGRIGGYAKCKKCVELEHLFDELFLDCNLCKYFL